MKKKILLVEPIRELLFSLNRYLTLDGYEVEEAFDGVIALNNFDNSFDLLIIDGDTPRVPCFEVIKLIKNKKKNIRVIVLMNDSILNADILVSNELVDDYIPRPFMPEDILEAINNLKLRHRTTGFFTNKEYLLLEKLREKEYLPYLEAYQLIYQNEVTLNTYIEVINKKLKEEEIELTEKGFKLVKKYGR
ncbi:MAG: response regulator [Bacilli bacterium]|nr:response regulator [Bacilli bacterium]